MAKRPTAKKRNGYASPIYEAYFFRANEQDPIVDWLKSRKGEVKDGEIENGGGPKRGTLNSWWSGKTRKPQFTTVAATCVVLGIQSIPISALARKK
jgi:hypothetical protein